MVTPGGGGPRRPAGLGAELLAVCIPAAMAGLPPDIAILSKKSIVVPPYRLATLFQPTPTQLLKDVLAGVFGNFLITSGCISFLAFSESIAQKTASFSKSERPSKNTQNTPLTHSSIENRKEQGIYKNKYHNGLFHPYFCSPSARPDAETPSVFLLTFLACARVICARSSVYFSIVSSYVLHHVCAYIWEKGTGEESPRRPCSEIDPKRDEVLSDCIFRNRHKTDTGIKKQELLRYNTKRQAIAKKIPQPLQSKACGQ